MEFIHPGLSRKPHKQEELEDARWQHRLTQYWGVPVL